MDKSDASLLMLAFLLIATSLLSLRGTVNDYEIHTPFPGGVLAKAKITDIKEYKQRRGIRRDIDLDYTDQNNRKQQARLEGSGDYSLKIGNTIEISYFPGNYSTARWPAGRVPDSEYYRWLKIFKAALIAGILCVLAIPAKRLFGTNNTSSSPGFEKKSRFVLSLSFGRVLFNLVVFTFFFSLLYVCIYLYLFHLTGLPLVTSQILMVATSGLFLLAIWNAVRPAVCHHPLVLTRRGFSVYNSGEIPWCEVCEIMIFRGYRNTYVLRFYLTDQSSAEPRQRAFGRVYDPARIALSLESSNWDAYELREELIFFALRDRDNDAATTFRRSVHYREQQSTGPISWPENMRDEKADKPKTKRSKSNYMSSGFHLKNH